MFVFLTIFGVFLSPALGQVCPEPFGVQTYPHETICDKFYLCVNGTFSEEICENGLVYGEGHGAAHNFCNYNWEVDCGTRIYDDTPISSPGCLYQFGIYPIGVGCQTTFFKCAAGVAVETPCVAGLSYDPEGHICNYPDSVPECVGQSEAVIGFKCPHPAEIPPNSVARRFLPFPRFAIPNNPTGYIVCIGDTPRINYCGDDSVFDPQGLTCVFTGPPGAIPH